MWVAGLGVEQHGAGCWVERVVGLAVGRGWVAGLGDGRGWVASLGVERRWVVPEQER